jgi:hypothetical protein
MLAENLQMIASIKRGERIENRSYPIVILHQLKEAIDIHPGLLQNVGKRRMLNWLMGRNCQF